MKEKSTYFTSIFLCALFTLTWMMFYILPLSSTFLYRYVWGGTYEILALYGAFWGFVTAYRWGGKNHIAKTLFAFATGLLLQGLGHIYNSFLMYSQAVEFPPYPSFADALFTGSAVMYVIGIICLAQVAGFFAIVKRPLIKLSAVIVGGIGVVLFSIFILHSYEFPQGGLNESILDLSYAFGPVLYTVLALIALIISPNILGGLMGKAMIFTLFAFIFQFISSYLFLHEMAGGSYYIGDLSDFLHMLSFFFMTLTILYISTMFGQIRSK